MKLLDGGATILIAISVIYFADYLFKKSTPKQCFYQEEIKQGVLVAEWVDCDTIKRGEK